jgi:preprotein translocase subunit SecG
MSVWFWLMTVVFAIVAGVMILIILVQRPQGGGLAGAFGGAGGSGTETVFGGRVGDVLTLATVAAFVMWLGLAIALNLLDNPRPGAVVAGPPPGGLSAPLETGSAPGEPGQGTGPFETPGAPGPSPGQSTRDTTPSTPPAEDSPEGVP